MIGAALALSAVLLLVGGVLLYRFERQRRLDANLNQTFWQAADRRNEGQDYSTQIVRMRKLIRDGANVNEGSLGIPVLQQAVWLVDDQELSLVRELLDHGADVNAIESGHTALGTAAASGAPHLVALLLARGADPNLKCEQSTPLKLTARQLAALKRRQIRRRLPGGQKRIGEYEEVIRLLRRAGARE